MLLNLTTLFLTFFALSSPTTSPARMDKKGIADILDEMGTLLELQGANPFKARAYHNASRALEGITEDLDTLVASGGILDIQGIGKTTAVVIGDLLRTGRSKEYDELRSGFPPGVLDMLKIQGLGPKKVKVLYDTLKISSLEELERAASTDKLAALAGFGKKSQENILKGIAVLRNRGTRTLYPRAFTAARRVLDALLEVTGVIRGEIAGSLRRRKETIGDIDIVVSAKDSDRSRIMEAFVQHADVQTVLAHGETKSSVVVQPGIQCDLRIVSDEEFPFALNYFTGSKEHNVEMRSRARRYGWSLNEYGFSAIDAAETRGKAKRAVKCKVEADVYKALNLDYVPPELRENMGEIDAAESGMLPQLVEWQDIKGTFHCHTVYSDGVNTIEQMATAAKVFGWEYLGIADHSKSAVYAGGLTEEKLRAQFEEIDRLNDTAKGFHIFKGTECDILPNGELDWPDHVLAQFDFVVISVHAGFNFSAAEMTKRIIKALKSKFVTMLGHPTGRLLLSREEYPLDMKSIIDAAADYGKMIEINAHPTRLDLDWRFCRYARDKGVLIPINPDAHNVAGLRDVEYGVGVARKGWLRKEDVLNTRSAAAIHKLLNKGG